MGFTRPAMDLPGHYRLAIMCSASHVIGMNGHKGQLKAQPINNIR